MIDAEFIRMVQEANSEEAQNLFLGLAREEAKSRGLTIFFEGRYAQGRKADLKLISYTPFVIGQNEMDLVKLKGGILEALIFEIGCIAEIRNGVIRPDFIEFQKSYTESTHPFVTIHNYPIIYRGASDNLGAEYNGEWKVQENSFKDICESGTFQLFKITE